MSDYEISKAIKTAAFVVVVSLFLILLLVLFCVYRESDQDTTARIVEFLRDFAHN